MASQRLDLKQKCPNLERIFSIVSSEDKQILYVAGKLKSNDRNSKSKEMCPVFVIDCATASVLGKNHQDQIPTLNTRWVSSIRRIQIKKNKVLAILGNKYVLELRVVVFETVKNFVVGNPHQKRRPSAR